MATSSTPAQFTLSEVAEFCYKNKKHRGFKEHAYEQIANQIVWAATTNRLNLIADPDGLCGVCICTLHKDIKVLYVHHIVAVRNGFATFIKVAQQELPEYSIQGLRNSKLVTFNPFKLWAIVLQAQTKALAK